MSFAWVIYPLILFFSFFVSHSINSQSVTVMKSGQQSHVSPSSAIPASININEIKSSYGDFKELAKNFKENPLSILSKEQVKEMILNKMESSFWKKFLTEHPKVFDCLATIIIDPHALPSLMQILASEVKLKRYTYLVIFLQTLVLIVLLFFFRYHSPIKRFFYRSAWVLTLQSMGVLAFYGLFKVELGPLVKIIKSYC